MLNDAVTVFNYHSKTETWYPSVITGANVEMSDSVQPTTTGKTNTSLVNVIIPCTKGKVIQTTAGKKTFIGAKAFQKTDEPNSYFSLASDRDFLYVGEWESILPLSDEEYGEGLYNEMNQEYDGVYMISSVSYFDELPHFEVGGS